MRPYRAPVGSPLVVLAQDDDLTQHAADRHRHRENGEEEVQLAEDDLAQDEVEEAHSAPE